MLNKKEKIIVAASFAVIILGGITYLNKNKLADNFASNSFFNTVYKKNGYKKIKNEISRKIHDEDFLETADNLSFEKLEVTNDILKEPVLVSAINNPNKKEFFKNLFNENISYERAQNIYKILSSFNELETITPEFILYLEKEFGYFKENYDIEYFKGLPDSVLQKDKYVKLVTNEDLKNIIKNLPYNNINILSSLTEKNPVLLEFLERPFGTEKDLSLKEAEEKYFSQELTFEKMNDVYEISRDIAVLEKASLELKEFFKENLADFNYNKICDYGALYLSDRKNEIEINNEYALGNYTFENPYIKLNPYKRTPLGALVNFSGYEENPVRVTIKGVDKNPDYSYVIDKKTSEGIPVVALYPNTDNKVVIKILSTDKKSVLTEKTISIKTENLDDRLPVVVIEKDYEELFPGTLEPGMNTASFITEDKSLPFVFDNYGKIRYVFTPEENMGKIILRKDSENNWIWDNGKTIIKVNAFGKVSGDKIQINEYEELKINDDLTKGYTVNHIQGLPKKNNILIVYGFSSTTYSSAVFSEVDRKTREEYFRARIYFKKNKMEENNIIFGERTTLSPKSI